MGPSSLMVGPQIFCETARLVEDALFSELEREAIKNWISDHLLKLYFCIFHSRKRLLPEIYLQWCNSVFLVIQI